MVGAEVREQGVRLGGGGAVCIEEARGRTTHFGVHTELTDAPERGCPPTFSYESKSACAIGTRDGCTRVGEGRDR